MEISKGEKNTIPLSSQEVVPMTTPRQKNPSREGGRRRGRRLGLDV